MNVGFPTRQLRCCKISGNSDRNSSERANISTKLSIYANDLETIMNICGCVRDGDAVDACPFRDDCRSCAAVRHERIGRRTGQEAGAPSETDPDAFDARRSRFGRPGVTRCYVRRNSASGKAPGSARYDLPLRRRPAARPARRAAITSISLSRSAASRGSPESPHRRLPRRPTNRMDATCWRRPSAHAGPYASR
jgi:hypothetical protein